MYGLCSGMMLFLLGLIIGSFISAFTYRYPRGIQFVKGRSFCDRCKKSISWYDNLPLISFLILRGRCRNCGQSVSFRYPLIELTAALGFMVVGPNIVGLTIFSILFMIFVIDLEHQIIPDALTFLGILLLIVINPSISAVLGGLVCAFLLLFIHLATSGRGMGLGDVKFAILGGMLIGLRFSLIWLLLAFLTGGLAGIILILGKKAKLKDKIAFGPFLIIAIPLTLFYGEKILSWFYAN